VFRRQRGEWQGAIHEQVVARAGQPPLIVSTRSLPARLIHSGYLSEHMARHGKLDRNLRIASDAAAREGASPADLLDLGRSLKAAGRLDEATERCLEAADLGRGTHIEAAALHFAASCLLGLGQIAEAREAIARLRTVTERQGIADFLEAQAELQTGDGERALTLLRRIDDLVDDRGKRLGSAVLPLHIGMAHAMCGRWTDAADALVTAVVCEHAVPGNLGVLFDAMSRTGRLVSRLDGLFDEANAAAVVTEAGRLAADRTATPAVRFLAAAILTAAGDPSGPGLVIGVAPALDGSSFVTALLELDALAPDLLPRFVPAAASTPERTEAMVDALRQLGADDAASAICAPA
jgi:tetratricopeptide (TPR) repeat protein